ncbi:hypothetical protein F0562_024923 [Nyssa sinensis]|uniref:DUF4005 domain-containing protein n=1 Tax=Nyssa sinensis TaxID=561372 RepID=A0A5J5BDZ7_9ASTE|nr:hypothetical protein F0562_024923 [Nyssa sinensis]
MEGTVQPEVYSEKSKNGLGKALSSSVQDVLEQSLSDSAERKKETTVTVSKLPDIETAPEPLIVNEAIDLLPNDQTAVELQPSEKRGKGESIPVTNGELSPKEDLTGNENQKSCRKASPSAKPERAENGLQSRPTLPSYMAATESAKAKLRGQSSPRFGQDEPEKHNLTRRHSLPSSNSKMSQLSPRAQRPVQASGKGGNRSDRSLLSSRDGRSLLSSRDGNVKVIQAEWKR